MQVNGVFHLSDKATVRADGQGFVRGVSRIAAIKWQGPEVKYDPKQRGEEGYKVETTAGTTAFVAANTVSEVESFL